MTILAAGYFVKLPPITAVATGIVTAGPMTVRQRVVLSAVATAQQSTNSVVPSGGFANVAGTSVQAQGPRLTVSLPNSLLAVPTSLAGGAGFMSPILSSQGLLHVVCGVNMNQAGAIVLARYIDSAGALPIGNVTQSVTANQVAILDNSDGKGFAYFSIGVTNNAAALATLSAFGTLLMSA